VAKLGVEVELLALEYGGGRTAPMIPQKPVQTTLVPCCGALARRFRHSPGFEVALRKSCAGKDTLLHDNGLWLPTNHAAARVAREMKIPFIISPRGMLTPWAMRFHGFKKRLAWLLYQRRDLQSARVLHATSRQEAKEFRALGLTQPIAIIPNGVDVPFQKSEIGNRKSEIRTALFLSRIHPKKGLLDLAEAWNMVRPSGWRMVIAGGDEDGHLAEVKAEIRKQKLENSFEFIGEVADEKKWDLYRSADLFVLPTKSENFGIVIAEALACGLPVITTRDTPWEELRQRQCGWWVEIGARPLADALDEAIQLTDEERRAMGLRGRKLVEDNYTWSAAAKKMFAVYQWMLGTGSKPDCILSDISS
jgi:glycosyltransferase involved in cell wall biosynthesis